MPDDINIALDVLIIAKEEELTGFWERRIGEIKVLSKKLKSLTDLWYLDTPDTIISATGRVHLALVNVLMCRFGMQGSNWFSQFAHGFPLVGHLGQNGAFGESLKVFHKLRNPNELFIDSEARFRSRSHIGVKKEALVVSGESLSRKSDG